jgi:hypothetical protein
MMVGVDAALQGTDLPLARYRFTAHLEADLALPDYAGSLLRGVFGAALRRAACMTGLPDCKTCPLWRSCPYPALFETPSRPTQLAQRFSEVPNPYVIEPPAIGTRVIPASAPLVFHMVLVGGESLRQLPLVAHAWQRALADGMGQRRVRGELAAIDLVEPCRQGRAAPPGVAAHQIDVRSIHDQVDTCIPVYDPVTRRVQPHTPCWSSPACPGAVHAVHLHFDSPLRLQHNSMPLDVTELSPRTLVSHLLRRITLMLNLHLGIHTAPFDVHDLLALAESLSDERSDLHWKDWTRYSASQQQEMTLGGVIGRWSLYGADLAPLLPWFNLGRWLHVGKNATMGLGAYRLDVAASRVSLLDEQPT